MTDEPPKEPPRAGRSRFRVPHANEPDPAANTADIAKLTASIKPPPALAEAVTKTQDVAKLNALTGAVSPSFRSLMGESYAKLVEDTMRQRDEAHAALLPEREAISIPYAPDPQLQQLRAVVDGVNDVAAAQERAAEQQARAADQLATVAALGQQSNERLLVLGEYIEATNAELRDLRSAIDAGDKASDKKALVALVVAGVALGVSVIGAIAEVVGVLITTGKIKL